MKNRPLQVETASEAGTAKAHTKPVSVLLWSAFGIIVLFGVVYFAFLSD
jgi:hypothetical protein